ncbi:MAG: hypothetical protein PHP87_06850 [Syntrophomonas sp.]|uniref:hypothetical protein n=1 Tax=Syntrophomonas sp. TaxID=2053627 RepID=UPI00260BE5A5|nr:hypothetical protein [Syntrophomonas sp.]MDD4626789.1 hypothetical protein [Syntrophomonas sp.]
MKNMKATFGKGEQDKGSEGYGRTESASPSSTVAGKAQSKDRAFLDSSIEFEGHITLCVS